VKPAEITRHALLDQATDVFAEKGFDGASVREITRRADANQAAINYHFGGKDALYREVLKLALAALSQSSLLDEASIEALPREEAVRLFIRQQVTALLKHDELARYLRIFAWETVAPTRVFLDFVAGEKLSVMNDAERIVRRFLPAAAPKAEIAVATIWLTQQVAPFIRHYDTLSKPPLNLKIDGAFIEKLGVDLARMAVAGLSAREEATAAR
jgi:AcrR family transcriptional regulator